MLPKNESVLNILVHILEQFHRFSLGLLEAYSLSRICKIVLKYRYPKMFSTSTVLNWFHLQTTRNLVDNQKCQTGFRPLCNKIRFLEIFFVQKGNKCCIVGFCNKHGSRNTYLGTYLPIQRKLSQTLCYAH